MKVKDVIALAAQDLGREDLAAAAYDCAGQPSGELCSLLRCYNLVENEIALDYFPLCFSEELAVSEEGIPYANFSFAPVEILSVTKGGEPISFERYPERMRPKVRAGERVTVSYRYSPKEKCILSDCEVEAKISARLLSFGIACEFCLSNGQFAEAAMWERKYREALRAADVPHRRLSVRARRWA